MNIEKYKGELAIKQIKHDMDYSTRSKEHHIDSTKYGQNVFLSDASNAKMAIDKYNALMQSVDAKIKSDTVTLGSIICTLPRDFTGDKNSQIQFFNNVYHELIKKVGRDNVVYSVIHYDEPESQPHLEFKFCPIIKGIDKRCKSVAPQRKFSWDKLCNKEFYNNLHKDIQKAVKERGWNCTLVNDVTIRQMRQIAKTKALNSQSKEDWGKYYESGNKTVQELKDETTSELVKLRVQLGKTRDELSKTKQELSVTKTALNKANQQLEDLYVNSTETIQSGISHLKPDAAQREFDKPIFSVNKPCR